MKLIVALCLVSVVVAQLPSCLAYSQDYVRLLQFNNDVNADGKYSYSFEQSDGQTREETGEVKNAGLENESLVVRGSYSWIAPDNNVFTVTYTADENGYRPVSGSGPTGAVPASIASLLGLNQKNDKV